MKRHYLIWEEKPTNVIYWAPGFGNVTWFIMNKVDIPGFNHRFNRVIVIEK